MTTPSRSFTSAQVPAQFEALIQDIRPELHRYCARMIGSVVDAEDLVQEALAKAYAALPATEVANVRAWLFRIAHNKAIDYLRRASHQQLEYLDEQALLAEPDPPLASQEKIAMSRLSSTTVSALCISSRLIHLTARILCTLCRRSTRLPPVCGIAAMSHQ